MSDIKESTNKIQREVIKIGVLLKYGNDNITIIEEALRCENTGEKLESIDTIYHETSLTQEQKLFVIQKLLAYPKATRISIANQIKRRLETNENNN